MTEKEASPLEKFKKDRLSRKKERQRVLDNSITIGIILNRL
jgi:hypothetical protein